MPSDWDWFISTEYGRDKMLRSEIEELSSISASTNARNAQLSSQMASLRGSIESRLQTLSAAFDAYVELGDVREQLAAYGDLASVRRDVAAAVEVLAGGGQPTPVATGDQDYWLPHAMNAVIALVGGQADRAAEDRARTLSRDADLFVVTLLGALDRGHLVADWVPDLLTTDDTLSSAQVALWDAVLAGLFDPPVSGDRTAPTGALLEAIGQRWRSTLAAGTDQEWSRWVADQQNAAPESSEHGTVAQLRWVDDLLGGRVLLPLASQPPVGSGPRDQLRAAIGTIIASGSDAERDLLHRSRELRRRIEDPTGKPLPGPDEQPRQDVRDLVRRTFAAEEDPQRRDQMLTWLRPGLGQAVESAAAVPMEAAPPVTRRTPGGVLEIGPNGPQPASLARVRQSLTERAATPGLSPAVLGGGAALLAVLAVVAQVAGWGTGFAVLLGLAAVVVAGLAVRRVLALRRLRTEAEQDRKETDRIVADATATAAAAEAERQRLLAERDGLVTELRGRLGAPEPVSVAR